MHLMKRSKVLMVRAGAGPIGRMPVGRRSLTGRPVVTGTSAWAAGHREATPTATDRIELENETCLMTSIGIGAASWVRLA